MSLVEKIARPAVIAHRGACAHAPENTLASFRLALEHGADGIELDAKLSADGQVMVIHDQTVNRTTGRAGVVRQMSLAQLKTLDAGSFFASEFARQTIPTLDEVFQALGQSLLINVELTNYASPGDALPDLVAGLIIRHGLQERVLISSFHPWNLMRIRRKLPQIPVAILTQPAAKGRLMRGWFGRLFAPKFIHPYFSDIDLQSISAEHRRGRRVNAWTVNEPDEILRLTRIGIDGIITDDPLFTRRILEE